MGTDYFCDTGTDHYDPSRGNQFYSHRPLWDGASCAHPCCSFNNPPWFFKQLQLSADDIEMRVCRDQDDKMLPYKLYEYPNAAYSLAPSVLLTHFKNS